MATNLSAVAKIRWGILGTGFIAGKFAEALAFLPDAELAAVGSRTADSARRFAETFGIGRFHDSYKLLAQDPDIDVIYIATPHNLHMENTILCLNAGKAVLCEKPFAVNARQSAAMIDLARTKKLFLMEAMWTRFLPIIVKVRQWLSQGLIGEVRYMQADFGFSGDWQPQHRLLNPNLAGGALLDVGVYTVSLASMVFGQPPSKVTGLAHIGQTGVDEQSAMLLEFKDGQLAVLSCAVRTETPQQAIICGDKGRITIHPRFWKATKATISVYGQEDRTVEMPFAGNGYNYQAQEVMRCLRAGKLQSNIMPLDETLEIMKIMDELRSQWGLKYPIE
jgi:predicted dehydrogenase